MAGFCLEKCPDALFVLMCIIYYMRKFKKYFTVFLLYEFVIITILQINHYCVYVFNNNFCHGGNFKYFLMCVMFPALVGLFIWWVPEISGLFCKNKCECNANVNNNVPQNNPTSETILSQYIEKLLNAGIVFGIQNLAKKYPQYKKTLKNLADMIKK